MRFKDSISLEDSVEEDIDTDVLEDTKLCLRLLRLKYIGCSDGYGLYGLSFDRSKRDFKAHDEERSKSDRTPTYEVTRVANALEDENQIQNGSDGDNGNGENINGRNENPNENNRDARPVARECTYQDFMKCQQLNFKETEGVVRLQDVVRIANNLMDQKLKGYAVKNAKNKRRLEVNQRDNRGMQPPFKRPNVRGRNMARAYTTGNNKRKTYNGPLPLCDKCKLHHEGLALQGHYRSDCPRLKDQNRGNKTGKKNSVGKARGKAYVLGGGEANHDSNVVKGENFPLNTISAFYDIRFGCR
ncbi:hypothetical protein Tco_0803920 [Tanacetum coccineum]|uniref:Uncharacterized protein n=1 Tax=Tanacetum coccineum TaxID=301880 RepID=A0ABQ5A6P9_9ASTR